MVKYVLHYFAGRGAAKAARQVFKLAGQEFEDKRYTQEDFPAHKAEMPFGQMPVLEVDGKKLAQSFAITRYVAKQFGFAGKGNWEQAQVDALADQYKDFLTEVRPFFNVLFRGEAGDTEKVRIETFMPAVKKHLAFFTKYLKNNTSGFLVGDNVTFVDLMMAEFFDFIKEHAPEAVSELPEFATHAQKIQSIPQIKEWRELRPVTKF